MISGTKSARNQAIQQYMSQGMSREEAEKRAWMDMGKDTLNAFIVGGLAGGAMSGAGGVANILLPSTSQQLQDMGLTRAEAENLVNSQRPEREYSIQSLEDGRKYVKADRQVISGDNPKQWASQVTNYINQQIRNGRKVKLSMI